MNLRLSIWASFIYTCVKNRFEIVCKLLLKEEGKNVRKNKKERNVKDIGDWIGRESKIEFSSTKVQRFISLYINLMRKSFRIAA